MAGGAVLEGAGEPALPATPLPLPAWPVLAPDAALGVEPGRALDEGPLLVPPLS
jgi:hypothetical protein